MAIGVPHEVAHCFAFDALEEISAEDVDCAVRKVTNRRAPVGYVARMAGFAGRKKEYVIR
ncbi:MAG: hypothetical protein ACLRSW_16300 [Christensenellaceae bacterium]